MDTIYLVTTRLSDRCNLPKGEGKIKLHIDFDDRTDDFMIQHTRDLLLRIQRHSHADIAGQRDNS